MAQVVIDSSDDEDAHLFVDWKSGAGTKNTKTTKTSLPVVCLDSDSEVDDTKKKSFPDSSHQQCRLGSASDNPKRKSIDDEAIPKENEQKKKDERWKSEERELAAKQKQAEKTAQKQLKENAKKQKLEEKQMRKEEEKLRKLEVKAKAAEMRKAVKERSKWENGKFALQNTTVLIDHKIVESGLIAGQLLSRLAEKKLKYNVVSNPIQRSIIWTMKRPAGMNEADIDDPEEYSQLSLEEFNVPYVMIVFDAEDFISILSEGALHSHVRNVQMHYSSSTVCYLINKLKLNLHKQDQIRYKTGESSRERPNADKALAELLTDYTGVHSRLCVDEADVANHIAGLTRSLAECPFKKKLTYLYVSKNGDHIAKSDPNKEIIKKDIWLKALVALPKVSGACAIAIARKYPSMRSLLNAYLDPTTTVHQKEMLLEDLHKEGIGEVGRRIGPACSRRIYRIMMAQNGNLTTDHVEEGADQF